GINFSLGQRITRPDQAEDLMRDFDAVILATGAPRARYEMRGSQVDFKSHPQVTGASEFLERLERGFDKAEESARRTLDGQNVVIVGNRLTAADVIGKSLRAGAQSISVIDWYPVSLNELAARSSSHEEIVAKSQSEPSRYSIFDDSVVAGLKDESGLLAVEVRNKSSGHISAIKAHHVVMAIGYEGADPTVHELFRLSLRNGATVEADRYFGETRVPKLFCAGDNVHGASVLVDAGAMGARVGEAVHLYLNGQRPDITALMPSQVIQLDRNQPRTYIPLNVIR
ncbi:MAG: FAD-dependent oxidoreductase, partial [Deltaproteobacteria bacterium]|nr:FAD-dependent oxidoreductase [Deltaproteobacteria bacterium]